MTGLSAEIQVFPMVLTRKSATINNGHLIHKVDFLNLNSAKQQSSSNAPSLNLYAKYKRQSYNNEEEDNEKEIKHEGTDSETREKNLRGPKTVLCFSFHTA